jgi:hypothetical protein
MWAVLQNIVTAWIERGRDGYAIAALFLFFAFILAFAYLATQAGDGLASGLTALARLI